jgi:hypothetical protein
MAGESSGTNTDAPNFTVRFQRLYSSFSDKLLAPSDALASKDFSCKSKKKGKFAHEL